MSDSDVIQLVKAANYAAKAHRTQKRKDQSTPYINHPIGVANILAEEGGVTDADTLTAAFLHDVIEDCDKTQEELAEQFGAAVAAIVAEVSDAKGLTKQQRRQQQLDKVKQMSPKAKLVRMADKIYNLRDLTQFKPLLWSAEDVREYWSWSHALFQKGLRGQNAALETILVKLFRDQDFPDDFS